MGPKASDTLKEIETIRSGLDSKIAELERRLPPVAQLARRGIAIALGGGAGGTALWFVVRRLRKPKARPQQGTPPLAVHVLPSGTLPAAVAVAAIWAGVRLYEAKLRTGGEARKKPAPAVVRMPERGAAQ